MGWFGRGIGQFASDVGTGIDLAQQMKERAQQAQQRTQQMALETARLKLEQMKAPLELQELQQRIRQLQQPQYQGTVALPGGGIGAVTSDSSGVKMTPLVNPAVTPDMAKQHILKSASTLPPNQRGYATELISQLSDLNADPSKVVANWESYVGAVGRERPLAGDEPLGDRIPQLNQLLAARVRAVNPNERVASYFQLGPNATQKDFENVDKVLQAIEMARTKEAPVDLSPEALDALAGVYIHTGQAPPLGLGGVALREKLFNRVGEIVSGKGRPYAGTGDKIVDAKAGFQALSGALTQLQRQRSAVGAFEGTALRNLEMFEKVAKPVVDTGSPFVNKPLRQIEARLLGKDDLVVFNVARNVALTEISRVINNPNLVGVLSDEARGETGQLIGPDATISNIYKAAATLKQDMANRKIGLDQEIEAIRNQMMGLGTGTSGAAPVFTPGGGVAPSGNVDDEIMGLIKPH